MVNISPTEKEVDVRFTLEHPVAMEVTRCIFSKIFSKSEGLGCGTTKWENKFS